MKGARITEIDARDLIGRLIANEQGAEFVVTGLAFDAMSARVVIRFAELDRETGEPTDHEYGVTDLEGWSIHQPLHRK